MVRSTPLDPWATLQIEGKDVNLLLDTEAAFSVPPLWFGPLDSLTKTVMEIDGKSQSWNFTKPLHYRVGNWQGTHPFLYIPCCPAPLLERDLLCRLQTTVTWEKLEANNLLCLVSEYLQSDVEKQKSVPFLDEVNPQMWDVSSSGLTINFPAVKILLKPNAPYPWKRQYPLKPEALEGFRPLVNKYWDSGILITCESPDTTSVLPVKKLDGSYWFVQDLTAVN